MTIPLCWEQDRLTSDCSEDAVRAEVKVSVQDLADIGHKLLLAVGGAVTCLPSRNLGIAKKMERAVDGMSQLVSSLQSVANFTQMEDNMPTSFLCLHVANTHYEGLCQLAGTVVKSLTSWIMATQASLE